MTDPLFRKACELAGLEPTRRQASKWRNKRGRAYRHVVEAQRATNLRYHLLDSEQEMALNA